MCRLLLNAILLKYVGVCIPLGEGGGAEREEYIHLSRRASKLFHKEDMEVARHEESYHFELGMVLLTKSKAKLKELYNALST
jgi:hypothetical protein